MSAPVTQWFHYDRFNYFDSNRPLTNRRGWYDVKRGKCSLKFRAYWNGSQFSKFNILTPCTTARWFNAICKYPYVTAWRGLADKPATPPESKP